MMTERHFDAGLRAVKEQIVLMGGHVERAIEAATAALQDRNPARFAEVFEAERKINEAHMAVDDACVKLLALQQPMARDLRTVIAILKISTDLERMGDQSVNIAYNTETYFKEPALKVLQDLPEMAKQVRFMVREALDAFVRADDELARDVLKRDDQVDALKSKIFKDVIALMKADSSAVDRGLCLILVARNLERLGDHATNIAEDVIFVVTGQDIRHGHGKPHAKEERS